jgi:hypothetical protein
MLEYNLCKEFPSLTPLSIEKEGFYDIIDLYTDLRGLQIREETATEKNTKKIKGKRLVRRPASDNWF